MNIRKITSMTLVWSLIVLIFNSVVLYVVPEGRISNWAVWKFWGLDKHEWSAQHITVGVLLCVAGLLDIYFNWKPIMAYMKNQAKNFRLFTPASAVGLILTVIFIVGTYMHVPPMSTIIEFSEHIKAGAAKKYGDPPYGQAQSSSLKSFSARLRLDLAKAKELLEAKGIQISDDQEMIQSIAARNKISPQEVYEIIKPARLQADTTSSPQDDSEEIFVDATKAPRSGMGKKTIDQLCDEMGVDCNMVIEELGKKGMNIQPDMKLKELATENDTAPMQIYEMIEEISQNPDAQ